MDSIYLERIFHGEELVGIGMVCRTRETAVDFLREVKMEVEAERMNELVTYDEKDLRIVYKDASHKRYAYSFTKRYVK